VPGEISGQSGSTRVYQGSTRGARVLLEQGILCLTFLRKCGILLISYIGQGRNGAIGMDRRARGDAMDALVLTTVILALWWVLFKL
jgi:hypothetical protein